MFVFLRLPNRLAPTNNLGDADIAQGLRRTFYVLAAVEVLVAAIVFYCLRFQTIFAKSPTNADIRSIIRSESSRLVKGFKLGWHDRELALAFASGLVARAQTIVVSTFIPLAINQVCFASFYTCMH